MSASISNLKNSAGAFWDNLFASAPNAQLSLLGFDDFPYYSCTSFPPPSGCTFDYGHSPDLPFYSPGDGPAYDSKAAWQTAVNSLTVHSGDDDPESQIPALYKTLSGAALTWPTGSVDATTPPSGTFGGAEFRNDAEHLVILVTRWPFHNAKRIGDTTFQNPYNFTTYTSTDAANELASTNVRLLGIALNDDPQGFDFLTGPSGVTAHPGGGSVLPWIEGSNGVTERVAGTNGALISTAMSQGFSNLTWTVTAVPNHCSPLGIAFTPASQTQTAGTVAAFGEKVSVPAGTAPRTINCSIDFKIGTQTIASQPLAISVLAQRPDTRITKATIRPKHRSAKFSFKAIGRARGFQCALVKRAKTNHTQQRAKFSSCGSPKTYDHLVRGRYTFKVRAVNVAGHDLTPAIKAFKI